MTKKDCTKSPSAKQQPRLLDMTTMSRLLNPYQGQGNKHFFLGNGLGILHAPTKMFRLAIQQNVPFIIKDHRLGLIAGGEGVVSLNLVDRHLQTGMLVYLGPGTIINPVSISDHFEIFGIILFPDFAMPFPPDRMPPAFKGQLRDFEISVGDDDITTAHLVWNTLWHLVRTPDYSRETASSLVAALLCHYNNCYLKHTEQHAAGRSREQTLFDRFIQLVNRHYPEQHQIGFYAERMYMTQRHLSTSVRLATGTTAKEWIDRALITRIKVELKHTDKPVSRIADELHFPNPAFFCKFFKRLAGTTPGEYRREDGRTTATGQKERSEKSL